jgi:hypothetical protein
MRITRAVPCLLVTALLTLAAPPDSRAQAPATLLIKGATIIDGVADAPLRDRSLLIEGNTIREVLPADAAAPAGAQVLDLSGKFIIPGLFDSHVHREDYMGELFINHGVTSIVALENAPKALRAKSQDAQDLPRFFHPGGRLQLSNDTAEADIRQMVRTWLANEPDFAWFAQYNDRNSRAYAIAADEAHKAGFIIFGHTDNAPGSVCDGMDIIEHIWGFAEAVMSPEQLGAFKEGKFLTWATFLTDWSRLDAMIADAVRRGAYLNPTLHYEWGGMSRRALQRELEDYRVLSNPDLSYIPRNVVDGILGRQRQIKNFSSRYENTPWISRLPAQDRKEFEAGFQNVLEFTRRYVAAGGKIHAGTDTIAGGTPGLGMHHEMEMLVEAGLTPMQALKAATSWPAELLQGKNGARGTAKIERRSHERYLQHQEDRTGDEERTLGRTRLPSRVFHVGPARPPDRRVEPGAHDQRDAAQSRAGRIVARSRGAGGQRIYHDVAGPDRGDLGQDHVPQSKASGVRSAGERRGARVPRPLQPAGARAEHRDHRLPLGRGARLQSAAGRRDLEHGLPTGAAEISACPTEAGRAG